MLFISMLKEDSKKSKWKQKLSEESKKYFNAVNGMLDEQIDFAKAVAEIYKPISGRLSDPSATVPEDNPQGIEASELYQAVVKDLKRYLKTRFGID